MDKIFPSLFIYQFRIRDSSDKTLDQAHADMMSFSKVICLLTAYETEAQHPHFQGMIGLHEPCEDELRKHIRAHFKIEHKTHFSVSIKRSTTTNLKRYLVKEEHWRQYGLDEDELEKFVKASFKKPDKWKKKFIELDDKFLMTEMKWTEYIDAFQQVKLDMRQPINTSQLYKRLDMLMQRRDEKYKRARRDQMKTEFRLNYFLDH